MRSLPLLLLLLTAPVALAAPPEVAVSWQPKRVLLGRDTEVVLEVRVAPGSGPVSAAASSGRFASDRLEGGPVRTFRWTPPSVRYPLTAVFTFWVERAGEPSEVAVIRIPLAGQTTLDVSTAAGASVVVEVGGTRFGPVKADARGKARVPVEVPPGVRVARVLATRGDLHTDAAIPLDVPEVTPMVAALTPSPLPPKEGGWLLVAGEAALDPKALKLSAEGATLSPEGGEAPLRYRVKPAGKAASVAVTVRGAKGREPLARAEAKVAAVAPVPAVVPPEPRPPAPTPEPPKVSGTWQPSVFLLAGGAFAGGANTGPLGAVGVSLVPPWWGGRFAAELEAGLRSATFEGDDVDGQVAVSSHVLAVPVLASVRAELFQHARFFLYGRAGGGVVPFRHRLTIDFQDEVKESRLVGMGFLSIQGTYRLGRWSALAEVRGAWAPARTPWLDAQLGGLSAFLGLGFTP